MNVENFSDSQLLKIKNESLEIDSSPSNIHNLYAKLDLLLQREYRLSFFHRKGNSVKVILLDQS